MTPLSHAGSVARAEPRGLRALFVRDLSPDVVAFQDPIDEICARPAPPFLRATHYLVVALLVSLLLAAGLTRVDVVVVAGGRLVTATPPIVLQPMERSLIRELRVRPGEAVTRGQVLATLDPTFSEADSGALERQQRSDRALVRRLEAEDADQDFAPDPAAGEEDTLQRTLFRSRAAELTTRLGVFNQDIQRLMAEARSAEDTAASIGRELGVARSVEGMRQSLLQAQAGSRLTLLEAQAGRLRLEREQETATNRLRELRHGIESRAGERQAFVDAWRGARLEALVTARAELARTSAALAKATRLHELVVITAPVDGVVLDVAARTEGSVLREAEPLVTLVPRDATLIAEVMIASGDVGYTAIGADTQLKVEAFPYQRHGMATGRLESVSEESFAGGTEGSTASRGAFHRARVAITGDTLEHLPAGARLFPGMTVSAEIKAGTRSVLSYFLYPLSRGLNESLREP